MDYLDTEFKGVAKCGSLYSDDPLMRAHQEMLMARIDSLATNLYIVLMSRGIHEQSLATVTKVFDFLELELQKSETDYFLSMQGYSMVDLYAFPFISRLFYLKDSVLHDMYEKLALEEKYPRVYRWFKTVFARPELNDGKGIIPVIGFTNWLVELKPM